MWVKDNYSKEERELALEKSITCFAKSYIIAEEGYRRSLVIADDSQQIFLERVEMCQKLGLKASGSQERWDKTLQRERALFEKDPEEYKKNDPKLSPGRKAFRAHG